MAAVAYRKVRLSGKNDNLYIVSPLIPDQKPNPKIGPRVRGKSNTILIQNTVSEKANHKVS